MLASVSDTERLDDYEGKYMPVAGTVLHRDKTVWRAGTAVLGVPGLITLSAALFLALGGDPTAGPVWGLVALVPALILLACAALLTVLRVVVSTKEVQVQYGLFGPRIPVEAITKVSVEKYDWTEFGGWGIRYGGDGTWAYSIWKKGVRAVRIEWKKPDGSVRRAVVTSDDPERLAEAIERARAGAGKVPVRVRVAADLEQDESDASEEEEEAAAEETGEALDRARSRRS